jgi:hypothetical protein
MVAVYKTQKIRKMAEKKAALSSFYYYYYYLPTLPLTNQTVKSPELKTRGLGERSKLGESSHFP